MDAKTYLASLAPWANVKPLEDGVNASKDDLLDAEVSLPLADGVVFSSLRVVHLRRPYELSSRPLLVDVSRLPAA